MKARSFGIICAGWIVEKHTRRGGRKGFQQRTSFPAFTAPAAIGWAPVQGPILDAAPIIVGTSLAKKGLNDDCHGLIAVDKDQARSTHSSGACAGRRVRDIVNEFRPLPPAQCRAADHVAGATASDAPRSCRLDKLAEPDAGRQNPSQRYRPGPACGDLHLDIG